MNRYHRYYCNSAKWAKRLGESVVPWVLRDYDLGTDVLEIGPGPGLVTDLLRQRLPALTAIEIDDRLAASLAERMRGTNVTVVHGDGAAMPFEDGRFSSALSMAMLHHVPSAELQDRLIAEAFRVLKPGGSFIGMDSTVSLRFRLYHLFDTMVPAEPGTFGARLERAGFTGVVVREGKGAFRWRAMKPA
ncbi:MAG: class I SAM-dependent methyltransferase [Thermoflexaceae bacterium]|nr:class I SAM-dependent methyltransferase [Thermoflexaceae bacterium]